MSPCRHCQVETEASDGFCCLGCRAAFALVEDAGLEKGATFSTRPPQRGGVPQARPWLVAGDRVVVDVQGITCGACVWAIERLAERRALACRVNPGVGRVEVDGNDGVAVTAFLDDVETLGYRVGPANKTGDSESDGLVLRAGITAAAAMVAMSLAFSRYFGLGSAPGDAAWVNAFMVGEFVCAVVAVVFGGSWFFRSAVGALRLGIVAFDVPIAVGIVTAFVGSVASVVAGNDNGVFFDSVAMFVALMIGGRLAQRLVLAQSRAQLLEDTGLAGLAVVVVRDQIPRAVTAADVVRGDSLLIRPGDAVPVDVVVESGTASFSLAWITGEAEQHSYGPGDRIAAGACHGNGGAIVAVAAQDGRDSALLRLLAGRDDDGVGRAGGWRRFAEVSVVAVLVAALAAGVVHGLAHGVAAGVAVATAVLVVTCPCAFGLALPLIDELALSSLRRRGVYVRRAGFFERLRRVRAVVLDKTGTLTAATLVLSRASQAALADLDDDAKDALFQLVARSAHPKSRALTRALGGRVLQGDVVVDEQPGRGLFGHRTTGQTSSLQSAGEALVFAVVGQDRTSFSFDEELQRDARAEVQGLQARGLEVHMASGDHPARAAVIAGQLGIDAVHAGLGPDDKAALVTALGKDRVLFVGDGVNDAAAFAVAGIAGTPALDRPQLPARADFYTVSGGLGPLTSIVDVGRAWSLASSAVVAAAVVYNVAAVTAAAAGLLTPLLCALLMPASSVLTVLLARGVWSMSTTHRAQPASRPSLSTLSLSTETP